MEDRQQCQRSLHLRKEEWPLHFALQQLPLCLEHLEVYIFEYKNLIANFSQRANNFAWNAMIRKNP